MDKIEQSVVLPASLDRAWAAIANADQFGAWFGIAFSDPFTEGHTANGKIRATTVDPAIAALQKPLEGTPIAFDVEEIQPMRAFQFRWHPFAIDPTRDYSTERKTTVRLELQESEDATRLVITETGFVALPPDRSAAAFAAHQHGWSHQAQLITKYLTRAA
jgi:uncharacterized protein YndB with AHSA1/START domain